MMRFRFILLLFVTLSASGCDVTGEYSLPELRLPEYWRSLMGGEAANIVAVEEDKTGMQEKQWWRAFNDETLVSLIAQAEAENHDLRIALERVKEARTMRVVANSALYPSINAEGTATRGNRNNIFSDKAISLFEGAFDAVWEIDLFGGAQRKKEAAEAGIAVSKAELEEVMVTVRAEVARNYIDLRNAQAQIVIAQENARAQKETTGLTRALFDAGLSSDLQRAQSEALQRSIEAQIPMLEAEAERYKNQLAVLIGVIPQDLVRMPEKKETETASRIHVPMADIHIILEKPAKVISRRPDVKRAEQELRAATSLTAAEVTELYPKINLSAAFGIRNTSLAGGGSAWSIGAGVLQPIFNAGRIRAGIHAAEAREAVALATYEKQVLTALAGIETALVTYIKSQERLEALIDARKAAKEAVSFGDERYQKGLSPFLDVLTAQRELYSAESSLAEARADAARHFIALHKELGL